jgi:hypothetical protein
MRKMKNVKVFCSIVMVACIRGGEEGGGYGMQ